MHNGKKIGLALSGGGVRATAFHMGVLRGLHRLGILQEVDEISTVSGGSIAGVYYLLNREKKFEAICDDMVQKLQKSIELRTVLNPRMLATIWPSYSRSNVKASVYRSLFFGEKTLSSLPDAPKIFINAACLNTGKSWRFSKSRMGDWKIGMNGLPTTVPVATAVAASTSVPGIFPPIILETKAHFTTPPHGWKTIALCDGGVYDNQGTHALISDYKHEPCEYIISSDAAAPFRQQGTLPWRTIRVLLRQSDMMMARVRNQQYQRLLYGDYKQRCTTTYLSIDWTVEGSLALISKQSDRCEALGIRLEADTYATLNDRNTDEAHKLRDHMLTTLKFEAHGAYLPQERANEVSRIGTRLRALKPAEITMLMQHGETLAELQLRLYAPELIATA